MRGRIRPSFCDVVHRSQIECTLHAEGPPKRPAAFCLVKAPYLGMQVRPSARNRSVQVGRDDPG